MQKILIVEDDKKIVAALTVRLKAAGYETAAAFDAAMAGSVAAKERPDLVLLDISMPAGDGLLVAERLRKLPVPVDVPMIFLTASKRPGLREQAMALGAAGFFEKPYEADELLDAIKKALDE
ncbi:MAG: response regulator transcription factor [Gammaproteobacteria bacterium]